MEFILGIAVGAFLFGSGSCRAARFENSWEGRLAGWFAKKRFERCQRKAARLGFEKEFMEEWRNYEDRPFALQHGEAYRAFYCAKHRFQQSAATPA